MFKTLSHKKDVLSVTSIFIKKPIAIAIIGALASTLITSHAYAADAEKPSTDKSVTDKSATDDQNTNAQTTSQDENRLSSVVVTAQKREESAQEVATSISVLDGKDLLDRGIGRSASEILNYVPNASAGTQQHGRPRWWIRGVGTGQQQIDFPNPVGFYLDDVYISNASATGFPLFDLDRVEVLRGPQGTLWGKNTTGGAINVIAKKPTFSSDENYFKTDYGSYGDKIIEGAIGGSIIDERIAGRLSVHDENLDGRFTNLYQGNRQDGGLTDTAIRGQLLFELTPDLEALLNLHYRNYKTNGATSTVTGTGANGAYIAGYIPSTKITDVSTNAPDTSKSTQNGVSLNLKWQLGKYSLTSITGYEDWSSLALTDSDNTPLEISRGYTDATSRQISQEFRFASPREDQWNWLTGFHFFKEDIDSYSASATLPAASAAALAGTITAAPAYSLATFNHKTESYALFGSTTYNFTEQFNTTAGLRWTTEEKELHLNRIANPTPTGAGTAWSNYASWWNSYTGTTGGSGTFSSNPTKRWDALTYDLTPEYKLTQTDRVYFKFAHGVKSGGFNTAATNALALNTLNPENLNSYELGYKSEWLDGRLNFNANVFHYDYKNAQVNVVGLFNGSGTAISYLQNVASSHVDGAEFEVEALPINNLHITANIGYLQTKFDEFDIQNSGGNRNGNEFVRSPHFNSLLAADYKIPLDNGRKVVVGGDWHYIGDQYYFVDPQNNPLLNQAGYSIVNARVTYSTAKDRIEVTGYVNNLFDEDYHNHALPGSRITPVTGPAFAQSATGATTIWGPPRTGGVALTFRF